MEQNDETLFLDKNGTPKNFACEICGCMTKVAYEGAEPNTCEMCLPLEAEPDEEDCGYHSTRSRYFGLDD